MQCFLQNIKTFFIAKNTKGFNVEGQILFAALRLRGCCRKKINVGDVLVSCILKCDYLVNYDEMYL